ncbi:MAG TPA: hypothetical protein VFT74_21875 [Isosphaeraceae bacterium]|nr:hypothetical protein [Isosphaeraceae bacterium]
MKILASQISVGDRVAYCGETFVVARKVVDQYSGLIRFERNGGYPQYIAPEREVEVVRQPLPDPKPYKVYTRLYKANGDCEKRIHSFATKKAQWSFMDRTPRAITYYTS